MESNTVCGSDHRQYAAWQRRMAGDGLTPYRECQRWRMAFWLATTVAGIQAVVIAAILIGRWLQ
jgi:hypothetical protein